MSMSDDKKEITTYITFGIIAIVLIGGAILYDFLSDAELPDFCNDPQKIKDHTVFLLDFSDPITDDNEKQVKESIVEHKDSIAVGGKLTFLQITEKLYESHYEICKPKNPKGLIRNKQWSCGDNLKGIDKSRQEEVDRFCKFTNEIDTMIAVINDHAKSSLPSSPLIESIAEISRREDFTADKTRKIVLFSDLMQNTNQYSFYTNRAPQLVIEDALKSIQINLSNAEIDVQYIPRNQRAGARESWQNFFDAVNATMTITPL